MKSKKMDRKVYWLYNLMLRNMREHKNFSLKNYIDMYAEYNLMVDKIASGVGAPWEIKNRLGNTKVKLPKYLQWVKQYLS
jgi:hypothetical protein